MALSLSLVKVSGACRCDDYCVIPLKKGYSYSPTISEWLDDSVVYAKKAQEEIRKRKSEKSLEAKSKK